MMTTTIIYTIISLCAIGIASAVILYFVAQKFKVEEDPRIDTVESILPGANCGGCGKPGCRGFAEATVKATSLSGWRGGNHDESCRSLRHGSNGTNPANRGGKMQRHV